MKKLLILSGKGGTGKTTTATAFIRFSGSQAIADCDVDAPNLHLVNAVDGEPETFTFQGGDKSVVDPDKCIGCGKCQSACRFHAIEVKDGRAVVNESFCEGCGVCGYVCPTGAAALAPDQAGTRLLYTGDTVFSTATLKMGRGNSGKLVSEVKNALTEHARKGRLAVIDGSPGIGCPVISSVSGVNLVLIVAEPSLSGISDMERILNTADTLDAMAAVCVNKADTAPDKADAIEEYCHQHMIPFLGRIPYDKTASLAVNEGKSVADYDCPARAALYEIYLCVMDLLGFEV